MKFGWEKGDNLVFSCEVTTHECGKDQQYWPQGEMRNDDASISTDKPTHPLLFYMTLDLYTLYIVYA